MKPKKSLGQNFLRDEKVLEKIIQVSNLELSNNVIEIGPGEGVLTEKLLENGCRIIAIEKDDNLASKLDSRLRRNDKIKIINDDILEINLPKILKENNFQEYKLIANIPYYITSPIIQLFLETEILPTEMILMVQREVAERICAKPGQMSILSVSVQCCAKPELLFSVPKESFYPIPKVDSSVIKISNIQKKEKEESRKFFRVVKAGFSAKRKTLSNNLSNGLQIEKNEIEKVLKKANLNPSQRAQELSIEDWKNIATLIYESTPKLFE